MLLQNLIVIAKEFCVVKKKEKKVTSHDIP